jgi:hypothetical protein
LPMRGKALHGAVHEVHLLISLIRLFLPDLAPSTFPGEHWGLHYDSLLRPPEKELSRVFCENLS